MQTKPIAMSTLLTTAARWILSRHQKQASAFSLLPLAVAPIRQRWSSSNANLDDNAEGTVDNNSGATALIFDTETTGMVRFRDPYSNPSQPDLVQLGFLMVDTVDWKIRNQGSFLVQLRKNSAGIEEGAQKVHGISERDCSDFGIEHETALDVFENLCSKADVLVGHNIRFDAVVMQTAFYRGRNGSDSFSELLSSKKQVCTMLESIGLCKLPSKSSNSSATYKWPSLAEAFHYVTGGDKGEDGETLEGAHDALVDSEACLKVFRYLVEHGHVSVEKSPTKSPDAAATVAATERKTATTTSVDSTIAVEITNDELRNHDIEERNDGIDRSKEIEEAATHGHNVAETNGGIDRSREVEEGAAYDGGFNQSIEAKTAAGETTQLFDPASFSSDMVKKATDTNITGGTNSPSTTGESFRVRGNTYKHKEMIKQLGGRWDSQGKEWVFHENRFLSKLESYADLTIVRVSEEEVSRN